MSNSAEFMGWLNLERSNEPVILTETGVLGMLWKLVDDHIALKITPALIQVSEEPTKAQVVSAISKVYDPTGLFAPVVLVGKLIMQDFWRNEKVGCKDRAPDHLVKRWQQYQLGLSHLLT